MIKGNHIISWWIWGIMSIVFVSTLTDWGATAAIVSAVILIGTLCYRLHIIRSPFRIIISLDPYEFRPSDREHRDRRVLKDMVLGIGDTKLLIYASPRKGTTWDRVNVRFIERRFSRRFNRIWKYEGANPNLIAVSDFRDVIYERRGEIDGRYFEYDPDGHGGYDGVYIPPIHVKGGELVWYEVYVRAKGSWKGYFSFEGALDNKRAWTRIKAEVKREHTA